VRAKKRSIDFRPMGLGRQPRRREGWEENLLGSLSSGAEPSGEGETYGVLASA